jgi:lipopolysaccharide transport system permease protein
LAGSAVIVFFRDVRFVIPLLLQIWMYATPIIYPVSKIPSRLRPYYFLNPMVSIIDGYRRVLLLNQTPQLTQLAYGAGISIVLLVLSYVSFKWMEPTFADLI